jgi:hypothetical protein
MAKSGNTGHKAPDRAEPVSGGASRRPVWPLPGCKSRRNPRQREPSSARSFQTSRHHGLVICGRASGEKRDASVLHSSGTAPRRTSLSRLLLTLLCMVTCIVPARVRTRPPKAGLFAGRSSGAGDQGQRRASERFRRRRTAAQASWPDSKRRSVVLEAPTSAAEPPPIALLMVARRSQFRPPRTFA